MAEELAFYTGTLQYREIDFTFAFDKDELRLIPPKDKEYEIEWEWRRKSLGNGAFTLGDPVPVGADFLVGKCNETRNHIVFLPKQGAFLSIYNSVIRIPLVAYVVCKYDRDSIDRVSFSCPEINYIHPVNQAITLTLPEEEFQDKGIVSVSTQEFDRTTTEMQTFTVGNKEIKVYFGVSRSVSTNIHEPPLQLKSALMFEFEAINDYRFIYRLWWIAREFVRYRFEFPLTPYALLISGGQGTTVTSISQLRLYCKTHICLVQCPRRLIMIRHFWIVLMPICRDGR